MAGTHRQSDSEIESYAQGIKTPTDRQTDRLAHRLIPTMGKTRISTHPHAHTHSHRPIANAGQRSASGKRVKYVCCCGKNVRFENRDLEEPSF